MPRRPVEHIPVRDFVPPHCPWPGCPRHRPDNSRPFRFHRHGSYRVRGVPRPRYVCLTCRRTFSRQSFAFTYYAKRPELLVPIAAALQSSAAHRQIARMLGCAPSTVTRASARLGRHALLLLASLLAELGTPPEPLVLDHFEAFELTQDLPVGVGTAVGHRSWFWYGIDPALHRRGGRVSPFQRARLARRKTREKKGGYTGSFGRMLDAIGHFSEGNRPIVLHTDGHESYKTALARHRRRARFVHVATPNPRRGPKGSPRTPEARRRDERMYASDQLHALIRHSCKHHTRETIAFSRRVNAMLERAFLTAAWRNLVKGRSERRRDPTTPAMTLGLTTEPWSWRRVLSRRLFLGRIAVPESWRMIYRREWITPELGRNRRHDLRHAF